MNRTGIIVLIVIVAILLVLTFLLLNKKKNINETVTYVPAIPKPNPAPVPPVENTTPSTTEKVSENKTETTKPITEESSTRQILDSTIFSQNLKQLVKNSDDLYCTSEGYKRELSVLAIDVQTLQSQFNDAQAKRKASARPNPVLKASEDAINKKLIAAKAKLLETYNKCNKQK